MAVQEDIKRGGAPPGPQGASSTDEPRAPSLQSTDEAANALPAGPESSSPSELGVPEELEREAAPIVAASPTQLGTKRFVYAAYFAGAVAIAFVLSKALDFAWLKLQVLKPAVGEPRDDLIMPVSALIGGAIAVYCWYRTRTRELAEEVATEMGKVTWPSRTEVTNGTVVVILTTVVSTVFFALMDKFWGFVTNLVYGS